MTRGIKPRSEHTYFLTPEQASALAPPQERFRIIDHGEGTLSVATPSGRGNRWGVAASQRRVGPVAPEPGLHPLELWSGYDNPAKQQYERHAMASFVTLHADNSEDVYHVNMDFVILMARFQDQHTNLTFAQDVRRNITVRETPEQIMESCERAARL